MLIVLLAATANRTLRKGIKSYNKETLAQQVSSDIPSTYVVYLRTLSSPETHRELVPSHNLREVNRNVEVHQAKLSSKYNQKGGMHPFVRMFVNTASNAWSLV